MLLSVYPLRPTRLTSPAGLGMSSGDGPVGLSDDGGGDMDNLPLGSGSYSLRNTFLMA